MFSESEIDLIKPSIDPDLVARLGAGADLYAIPGNLKFPTPTDFNGTTYLGALAIQIDNPDNANNGTISTYWIRQDYVGCLNAVCPG